MLYETENREPLEQQLRAFLTDEKALEQVYLLLEQSSNLQMKLIVIESWNKIYRVLSKKKKNKQFSIIDENKEKVQMDQLVDQIIIFMLDYIYRLDLGSTPPFMVNTLANSIAEFLVFLLGRKNKNPAEYI